MNIAIDIRTLMDKNFSGVSIYTYNLLLKLVEIDKDNNYFLYYNSFKKVKFPEIPEKVKIYSTHYPNKIFNYILQKIFKYPKLDKIEKDIDIFWSPHFNFYTLSSKVKKVLTVHDISFVNYPEFFSRRKNFWHKSLNIKKKILNSDKIVTVSDNTRLDLLNTFKDLNNKKVKRIYSGLEEIFKERLNEDRKKEIKNKYNLPNKYILSLSTLEPRKNYVNLIKAYNLLREKRNDFKEYKLVIIGSKGWCFRDIIKERNKSKFKEDIIFLGYVDNIDKKYLYNLASVFVFSSFYEGFGFPVLEAMASKVPVVASFNSSISEIVGDTGILVDPEKKEEIEKGIQLILDNRGIREDNIEKAYNRSLEFSWEKTAREYIEMFNSFK
ncbi:glycosyltransferase family 1 protein [bacterium]|nr:glycosyltransferase family 1 protein [bacterium]